MRKILLTVLASMLFAGNTIGGQAVPEGHHDYRIEKTPDVAPEDIIEAIVAGHKGSVVLIDFWATWCSGCLAAMKEMEPIKAELEEHGVITIYVTFTFSPEEKFLATSKEIGGIHYYLDHKGLGALTSRYDFSGIPHYLIFNKAGEITYNAGFPGVDTIRRQIEKVW